MTFSSFIELYEQDPSKAAEWLAQNTAQLPSLIPNKDKDELLKLYQYEQNFAIQIVQALLKNKNNHAVLVSSAEEYIALEIKAPKLAALFDKKFIVPLFQTSEQYIQLIQTNAACAEQLFNQHPRRILSLFNTTDELEALAQTASPLAPKIKARKVLPSSESPIVLTEEQKDSILKAMDQALLSTRYSSLGHDKVSKLNSLVEIKEECAIDLKAVQKFIECASTPRTTFCFFQASYGKTGSATAFKNYLKNHDNTLFDLLLSQNLFNENQAARQATFW